MLSTTYDRNRKNYFNRCSKLLDNVGHHFHKITRQMLKAEGLT